MSVIHECRVAVQCFLASTCKCGVGRTVPITMRPTEEAIKVYVKLDISLPLLNQTVKDSRFVTWHFFSFFIRLQLIFSLQKKKNNNIILSLKKCDNANRRAWREKEREIGVRSSLEKICKRYWPRLRQFSPLLSPAVDVALSLLCSTNKANNKTRHWLMTLVIM